MSTAAQITVTSLHELCSAIRLAPASKLIAIDGGLHVGKSYVARQLAALLDARLVEGDLFIATIASHPANLDLAALRLVLTGAMSLTRPVLFESVQVLSILDLVDLQPDIHVYVTRPRNESIEVQPSLIGSETEARSTLADRLELLEAMGAGEHEPLDVIVRRYHLARKPHQQAAIIYRNVGGTA